MKTKLFPVFSLRGLLVFAALAAACLGVYGPALHYGFVAFDDDFHVYQNVVLNQKPAEALTDIWTGKAKLKNPKDRLYVPLTQTTFWIQSRYAGLNPFPYHLFSLLLHTANALLVFLFFKKMGAGFYQGAVGAFLFALHPLQVEAAVWVSGRKDLLFAFFFLAGLLFYKNYLMQKRRRDWGAVFLCFVLSALSKPTAVMMIPVLFLLDWNHGRSLRGGAVWFEKAAFLLPAVFVVAMNLDGYGLQGLPARFLGSQVLFVLQSFFFYAGLFLFPLKLSAFYPFPPDLVWPLKDALILAGGLIFIAAGFFVLRGRRRLWSEGILFFMITLVPVLFRTAAYTDGGFASARYMYLPMLGLLWIFSGMLSSNRLRLGLGAAAVCVCAVLSFIYTGTWKDSESLSLNVTEKYPYAANAQDQLARIYEKRGWARQAALRYEEAYRVNPTFWRRAKMNAARGEIERAMEDFQAASAAARQPGLFYEDWGLFYLYLKKYGQAKDIFETALQQDPFNPNLYNNLAGALFYMQEPDRAEALWEKALELNPQFSDAYNNLGFVYEMRGRIKLAEQFYETALRHDPSHVRAARNLKRLREANLKS